MDRQLVCMLGLPRSGKSTVAGTLSVELGAPVVNRDSIRLALHGQRYVASAELMVKAIAKVMVTSLFAYHDTVIVDETNIKHSTRAFWRDGDWKTAFLELDTSKELCLARAKSMNDEQIQPVIERMAAEMEPLGSVEEEVEIYWLDDDAVPGARAALKRAETQWPNEGD